VSALSLRVGLVYMEPILTPIPMKEQQEKRIKELLWILSVNFSDVRFLHYSIQLLPGTAAAMQN
jgi:hypothetical protein